MTCFKPFPALRPRADLAQLALCPPYDVVTRREAEEIIGKNKFDDGDYECSDPQILHVLQYYKIRH